MSIEKAVLDELVQGILRVLGKNVISVILYGSTARGTAEKDSDVDIALIVKRPISADEDDALADIIVDMDLKYGKVFSVIDIEDSEFRKWQNIVPFYGNVVNEGVVLWKAA